MDLFIFILLILKVLLDFLPNNEYGKQWLTLLVVMLTKCNNKWLGLNNKIIPIYKMIKDYL